MRSLFVPSFLMFSWLVIYSSVQAHEDAVVAIRSFDQGEYGTGFVTRLNGNKVIITNIHVVQGENNPSVTYSKSGKDPLTIDTKIKQLFPNYDLAVLEPLQELPQEILPLPRKEMTPAELKAEKNIRVIGYFRGGDGYDQQNSRVEVTNDQLREPSYLNMRGQRITNPIKVITIGGICYNGMSGSPILLGRQVVGVMWASVNEGGGFCWALPISYLKKESVPWRTWSGMQFPVLEFRESLRSGTRMAVRKVEGWSTPYNRKMNWYEAREFCNNYTDSGHSNWRLPTLDELEGATKETLGIMDQKVWAEKNNRPAYFNFETDDRNANVASDRSRYVLCIAD